MSTPGLHHKVMGMNEQLPIFSDEFAHSIYSFSLIIPSSQYGAPAIIRFTICAATP